MFIVLARLEGPRRAHFNHPHKVDAKLCDLVHKSLPVSPFWVWPESSRNTVDHGKDKINEEGKNSECCVECLAWMTSQNTNDYRQTPFVKPKRTAALMAAQLVII